MNREIEHRDSLVAVNTEAHRYYREQLLTSPTARGPCHYLTQRRLSHVLTADSPWPVGYAPPGWTNLNEHLHKVGFTSEELLAAGLARRTHHGDIVDRFRDRIMLAQRNHNGDIVGFIGRAAPGSPTGAPKYLNSPHTEIYNKSELLFGLHEQLETLARGFRPVLVEGPLDVLAIAAINLAHGPRLAGVAPCGTALTTAHVLLLAHHITNRGIVVAYDNDYAGSRAATSAYELLADCQPHSVEQLAAATLTRGTDPAEVLQVHGPQALRATLTDPQRLIPLGQHAIDTELRAWTRVLDGAEGRVAAVKAVAPLVAKLPNSAVARQVTHLAEHVSLDPTTVTIALTEALAAPKDPQGRRQGPLSSSASPPRAPMFGAVTRSPGWHVL
jgi:DNA primase catalytic core